MSLMFDGLKLLAGVTVVAVLLSTSKSAAAQVCGATCAEPEAPAVDCETGCDRYLSGRGHRQLREGEVGCIREGESFRGGVNVSGGQLRVCGAAALRYANVDGGSLTVLGRARVLWLNTKGESATIENHGWLHVANLGLWGRLENHGAMIVKGALNVGSHAEVYNTSDLVVAASVHNDGALENAGDLVVHGNLYNAGGGRLSNDCSATVDGHASIGGVAKNAGLLSVAGAMKVDQELQLGAYSQVQAGDLMVNGSIVGQYNDCSSVLVAGKTIINGSIEEKVDVCGASEVQAVKGALGYQATTDCSCDPTVAESLVLFDVQPADLARIECIDTLRNLTLYECSFPNLEGFPALANLESLSIDHAGLTTLAGLPSLPNLTQLAIEHNDLTELDSLPALPALHTLYAGNNPIVSALGLSATPALEWLDLHNTEIQSVAEVPPLDSLQTLLLDHEFKGPHQDWEYLPLADLPALAAFPALEWLDMSGRMLTSLLGFPTRSELRYLYLDDNELVDLAGLPSQPALERLTLYNNPMDAATVADQAKTLGLELCSYPELAPPGACY